MSQVMRDEVRQFFDEFVEAFPSFCGAQIADRYLTPYMAIQDDGAGRVLVDHDAVSEYFQGFLDRYRNRGCSACRYADLDVQSLGGHALLGTVTWELCGTAGEVLSRWRESYVLVRVEGQLKIRASIDHARQ